jgi:rhomboid protease GluP
MMFLLAVLVIGGFAVYVMKPDERVKLLQRGQAAARQAAELAVEYHRNRDAFREALHTRTPRPIVLPVLVAVNAGIFIGMIFGAGAIADPATLVAWGASVGPRTTNGEWWRLVTALFVHTGFWHLVINMAGLVAVGLTLERLAGHFTFAAIYLAAGTFASLVSLHASPLAVSAGASGAIFGIYGLLIAAIAWGRFRQSPLTIPLKTLKIKAPATAIFILYGLGTSRGNGAELTGLITGLLCGLVLLQGVSERTPPPRRIAIAVAVTLGIAVALAVPLRSMTDARPEIARVIEFEGRTAEAYKAAVNQFRLGAINAEALAKLIERTIVPDLQKVLTRVTSLKRVPPVQEALVMSAEMYLRLRDQSWRLRAEALHKSNMKSLRKADEAEHESLEAFEQLKAAAPVELAQGS